MKVKELESIMELSDSDREILKAANEKSLIELEREAVKQRFEVARLSTMMVEYSDYDELKKELEIFKVMEGGDLVLEDGKTAPLERLVIEKNKKLENENTSLKVAL